MGILRVLAIGGVLWLLVRAIFLGVSKCMEVFHNHRLSRLSLLSEEVSQELGQSLKDCLTAFEEAVASCLGDVEAQCERLNGLLTAFVKHSQEQDHDSSEAASTVGTGSTVGSNESEVSDA
jgi:hypothetical protein